MKKIYYLVLIISIMISVSLTVYGNEDEGSENIVYTIDSIESGVSKTNNQKFKIDIPSKGVLTITLSSHGTYQDIQMMVMLKNNMVISDMDENQQQVEIGANLCKDFRYQLDEGTYYIWITGGASYGDGIADFSLSTMFNPDVGLNNNMNTNFSAEVISNIGTVTGAMDKTATNVYEYNVTSDGRLDIAITGYSYYTDVYLEVFTLTGGQISEKQSQLNKVSFEGKGRHIYSYDLIEGTYYIRIDGSTSLSGDVQYTFNTMFTNESADNNGKITCDFEPLKFDEMNYTYSEVGRDTTHYYMFNLNEKSLIKVKLSDDGDYEEVHMVLFDVRNGAILPDNCLVEEQSTDYEAEYEYTLERGVYFIRVCGSTSYDWNIKYALSYYISEIFTESPTTKNNIEESSKEDITTKEQETSVVLEETSNNTEENNFDNNNNSEETNDSSYIVLGIICIIAVLMIITTIIVVVIILKRK